MNRPIRVVSIGIAMIAIVVWLGIRKPKGPMDGANTNGHAPECALKEIAQDIGIQFVHNPGPPTFFLPEIMGSGLALLDFDRDGRMDIYLVNGTAGPPHPLGTADTSQSSDALYQQQPDGRFVDVTGASGIDESNYGMGVAVGDVNNDGFVDLYIVNFGCDRLLLNQGGRRFTDITRSSGIEDSKWGSSAAFFDYDRDGRLDVFVVNYVEQPRPSPCRSANGSEDYCTPNQFAYTRGRLLHNVSDTAAARSDPTAVRFDDATEPSGIGSKSGPGLGIQPGDFNDDGWPDLYVANDGTGNFLWLNQRDGTFREMAIPLGAAYSVAGKAQAGMGIAFGDADSDQRLDLVVTNLPGEGATLYRNNSTMGFTDISATSNILQLTLNSTGFGVALADIDHDGDLDLFLVNGRVYQPMDQPAVLPPSPKNTDTLLLQRFWGAYAQPNQFLRNDGRGQFEDDSAASGDFCRLSEVSRGLAVGDLDNDGDLDLVATNVAGRTRVYRNDIPKRGHWLMLSAVDPALGGRDAYGATVTVRAGSRQWVRYLQPASSYQSSHDPRLHYGVGSAIRIEEIEVQWPDGIVEKFEGGSIDCQRTLQRGSGSRP